MAGKTVTEDIAMTVKRARLAKVREQVPTWAEAVIRQDEREKLAALITEHADTIASFAGDKRKCVELLAMCVALKQEG